MNLCNIIRLIKLITMISIICYSSIAFSQARKSQINESALSVSQPLPTHYKSTNNGIISIELVEWQHENYVKGFLGNLDCSPDEGIGYHWLIMNLLVTNISDRDLDIIAPVLGITLIDTDNYHYDISTQCVSDDELKYATHLESGGKTKLKIKFAIPKSATVKRLKWKNYPDHARNTMEFYNEENIPVSGNSSLKAEGNHESSIEPESKNYTADSYKYLSQVSLDGLLLSSIADAAITHDGKPHDFPALQLKKPISVLCDSGETECDTALGVTLIQLVLKDTQFEQFKSLKGKQTRVEGNLFQSHTGHHYTSVLLDVQSIDSRNPLRNTMPETLENRDAKSRSNESAAKFSLTSGVLEKIFDPQMLNVDLAYFESITGPAKKTNKNKKQYIVDNCYVTVTANGGTIKSFHLSISEECSFDLNKYLIHFSGAFPPIHRMTFGDFSSITNGGTFFADCLLGCPNTTDPLIYEYWKGSHADLDNLSVMLEVSLSDTTSIDAAGKWRREMEINEGNQWIENKLFNCDGKYNRFALESFREVVISGITIGNEIEHPPCPVPLTGVSSTENEYVKKPNLYALVIGVSEYNDTDLNLLYPAKDAKDFSNALKRQEGGLYASYYVRLLQNPEKKDIYNGLRWLLGEVTDKDMAVLYLSGHGQMEESNDYYFLTKESNPRNLKDTAVSYFYIKEIISKISGKTLLFVDTTHEVSKVITKSAASSDEIFLNTPDSDYPNMNYNTINDNQTKEAVNKFNSAENGVIVFASSTGKQLTEENPKLGNSAFAKALIEGLDGAANITIDGAITINHLDLYLSERVKKLTGNKQTPVTTKPEVISDFPIAMKVVGTDHEGNESSYNYSYEVNNWVLSLRPTVKSWHEISGKINERKKNEGFLNEINIYTDCDRYLISLNQLFNSPGLDKKSRASGKPSIRFHMNSGKYKLNYLGMQHGVQTFNLDSSTWDALKNAKWAKLSFVGEDEIPVEIKFEMINLPLLMRAIDSSCK